MDWLDEDLASRTVADRLALYHKHLGDKFNTFTTEQDRVRLIEDTDGDGKADRSTVFADGFHSAESGIGVGDHSPRGFRYRVTSSAADGSRTCTMSDTIEKAINVLNFPQPS